ncbi:MAG TPA: Gfo/Idh/MocA family oxidoreductase [Candidatus Dormibacteraeota bacterium]|nr:Gfo/Idh/MocA family oxidoreductase [Candidatus Dormibacteraeota bacterium]
MVGLGTIARFHLDALQRRGDVSVEAGVDPAPGKSLEFGGQARPVYPSISALLERHEVDDVIVATPTPTHVEVCEEILEAEARPRILVEKPLATAPGEVERVLARAGERQQPLDVLYHFRWAPEVLWAAAWWEEHRDDHGPVVDFLSFFSDPYAAMEPGRRWTYVSSWIDSGINALSLLDRLVDLREISTLTRMPGASSTYEAEIRFASQGREFTGHLMTTWHVTQDSKWTCLRLADGLELFLDHVAVLGRALHRGRTIAFQGSDGTVPRRTAHYLNLFHEVLSPTYSPQVERHRHLHHLLLDRLTQGGG